MVATSIVELLNRTPVSSSETIVILNNVECCESASTKIKSETTTHVNMKCQSKSQQMTLIIATIAPIATICMVAAVFLCTNHKKRLCDAIWRTKVSELKFEHPHEIIGRATFGLVLHVEHRGMPVAVKRVLPPSASNKDANIEWKL